MLKAFKKHIDTTLEFLLKKRLIIAISGGLDSVVLAHLCKSLSLNFALAHCNFNLRAEESNTDEDFVLELADQLEVEVFIQNFDTQAYADQNKRSIQMAARELRYDWFNELATQLQFDYILTAHHADDNLETFLINFTRGTGLNGLTGIPVVNDNIVRPMLPFSRETIEAYARAHAINWREDSSNSSRKYLRNKLRHEVVPILKEINPQLLDSLQNTLENLNDTADIVEESLDAVLKRAITNIDENGITFKISDFSKLNNPKAYLFEMFKTYGFTQWNDIVNLLDAQSGKQVLSNSHRLIKHREHLILTEIKEGIQDAITLSDVEVQSGAKDTDLGEFSFEDVILIDSGSKNKIYIDKNKLTFPLELRLWKEGDYFHPIGMKGKKKISKYLKDEKLSLIEKEKTWLLISNDKVVWVVGKRADNRFRVTETTKSILKIELN
ncbi:tRNA lysidine(34) synthetase TilS [Winogradskyella sp. UBA3174]|uniref:tRNA lysidine(34) synthetase TilS n=1 Tax=Winogradskyella sp. UBA3174 TaxID=1947785 RepID=UPI0025F5AC01|nr:tRNA lysidine(34) synthetase TilS [Winogradskyella sp. UBA3174]|tara:strand:+ start:4565 stop:5884 length:1320 start_codon:yes stop_codon:yes gene_type:complete